MKTQIIQGLWIGNIKSRSEEGDFSVIINCAEEDIIQKYNIQDTLQDTDIVNLCIEEDKYKDITMFNILNTVYETIDYHLNFSGNVLVHCYAGIHRSPAICACYIMRKYNISPEKAYLFIKKKWPITEFTYMNSLKLENERLKYSNGRGNLEEINE